ncbi:MAG TPA: radical SAM family heme chaperone HemW [Bryobacteraceae bacterium]|nr:radical SAM family heme chaperone HemW [Bryobacteraceae bacterium]
MPGVYISWPFCAQKCTYCNFASGVFPKELEGRYADRLAQEIAGTGWPWTPETVYWGGGTPSQIDNETVRRIMGLLPGRPWPEATMEAAPGTFDAGRIAAWRDAGINRVSLGVQSFNDNELRRTGRKHTAGIVAADVAALRANGIPDFNIDLIAGLAGQTPESWEQSLDAALALNPPHVSVYMLEVDEDSRLGLEILQNGNRYGARDVPTEEATAAMYERAVERLAAAGIVRYEISNFARPGNESRHNLKYWRLEPYLGFGADAHSFAGGQRWQNVELAASYVAAPALRLPAETANPAEERFFVGLRLTAGVAPTPAEWALHGPALHRFISQGLMEKDGQTVRLTSRGILLSNEIFQEFLSA